MEEELVILNRPTNATRLGAGDSNDTQSENQVLVRDYDFENEVEDDFERQVDFEFNNAENQKFRNELLFAVQGLGSVREVGGLSVYVKGSHCDDSVKDLIKFCKRDDTDNPATRIELGKWQILQNDLLPLLITQSQDKQLTFYLMILLVLLTESPTNDSPSRAEIIKILQDYKIAFLSNEVINSILLHLADCLHKDADQRNKLHDQMVELIVTLFRNLLRIPDAPRTANVSEEVRQNLQLLFFKILHQEQAFEAFVYLTQNLSTNQRSKTMNLFFLEIFYHLFSPFEPSWIMKSDEETKTLIQKISEDEEKARKKKLAELSSRHARFDCSLKVTRKIDRSSKIIHNPFEKNFDDFSYGGQLKKPKLRKFNPKHQTIFDKSLNKEILVNEMLRKDEIEEDMNLKKVVKNFAIDFLEHAFNSLIEVCYEEIYKDTDRVDESDRIHYFIVTGFCLEINRSRFAQDVKAKNKVADRDLHPILELDIKCIGAALQITHFELLYSALVREVTKEKKTGFNIRIFHAALYAFLQLLKTIKEMSLAPDSAIRRAAQIITQNLFYHDITKILRIGFNYLNPDVHDPKLYSDIIELVGVFFDMLEEYSKGKILSIQTDRRVKKKKLKAKKRKPKNKKNKKENLFEEDFENGDGIQRENNGDASNNENDEISSDDNEEDEDNELEAGEEFKERKFNFTSEFAVLVDYSVISKMLNAIAGNKLQTNHESINNAVMKFIHRIINLLKADWIFYQIDYLMIFQEILNVNMTKVLISNQQLVNLIQLILRNYFALLKKNKLLLVESLFRFSDRFIKDEILANYQPEQNHEEHHPNDDRRDTNEEEVKDYGILGDIDRDYEKINKEYQRSNLWNQYSDSLLIKYYGEYENIEKNEEHLCLLLHSFGVKDLTPKDIHRRIRLLKLHRSKEKAEQIFKEMYYNSEKVSLPEAIKLAFVNISGRSFTANELKSFINEIFEKYIHYKQETCNGGDTSFLDSNDFAIIPLEMKHFDMLEWQVTEQIFIALNFRGPKQGEIYWRIPGLIRANDAEISKEEFNRCFEEIERNPETKDLLERAQQIETEDLNRNSDQEDANAASENNDDLYNEAENKEQETLQQKSEEEPKKHEDIVQEDDEGEELF